MTTLTKAKTAGRPPTGRTKTKTSITIDDKILKAAQKHAFKQGVSLSSLIESAVRETLTAKKP